MNTKQMIEVMQAALDGKQIEYRDLDKYEDGWKKYPTQAPAWHWGSFDYRVKVETKIKYINVYANGQPNEWGVAKGDLCYYDTLKEAQGGKGSGCLGTLRVEVK